MWRRIGRQNGLCDREISGRALSTQDSSWAGDWVNRPYLNPQPNGAVALGIVHGEDLRAGIAIISRALFRRKDGAERAQHEAQEKQRCFGR
jgi:hypothetical protein